jgi:hypothetical protein
LASSKKNTRELWHEELVPGSACGVQDQHGIRDTPVRVPGWLAEGRVMQFQFRQCFARLELEIVNDEIAFGFLGILGTRRGCSQEPN